jgi:hypothetical protein
MWYQLPSNLGLPIILTIIITRCGAFGRRWAQESTDHVSSTVQVHWWPVNNGKVNYHCTIVFSLTSFSLIRLFNFLNNCCTVWAIAHQNHHFSANLLRRLSWAEYCTCYHPYIKPVSSNQTQSAKCTHTQIQAVCIPSMEYIYYYILDGQKKYQHPPPRF